MAGIYIHIPFCKQACHYCDFHFSTNLSFIQDVHEFILKELKIRKHYLDGQLIKTIYFGGGTPSLLSGNQIREILDLIRQYYQVDTNPEVTLEANPDDLDPDKLQSLQTAGINRLSIGVQSFDDNRLKYINRAHTSSEAINTLNQAFEAGFENITADLIYAIPPESLEDWGKDLEKMVSLKLPHISLYGLTIEEKTAFGKWAATGKLIETTEDMAAAQYRYAIDYLNNAGYIQYEVSNFAKPGYESRHNGGYWKGDHYLGIGPGAHSYNGQTRSYNIANNIKYIKALSQNKIPETVEELSDIQLLNEKILTGLRTKKGINLESVLSDFNIDLLQDKQVEIKQLIQSGLATIETNQLCLTTDGFMVADDVALRLFYDE